MELLITDICRIFPDIKFLASFDLVGNYRSVNKHIISDKIVYICQSTITGELLKVGQSTNWKNRIVYYSYRDKSLSPIKIYLFETQSWQRQDEIEILLRKHLEEQGHILPWDSTNNRLMKIKQKVIT